VSVETPCRLGENRGVTSSPLTAHFQLEQADVDAFGNFLTLGGKVSGSKTQLIIRTLLILFGALLAFGIFFRSQLPPPRPSYYSRPASRGSNWLLLAPTVGPLLMVPIFYIIIVASNKKARQKLPILTNPSTVTLSEEGFRVEFGPTNNFTRWDGVPRIESTLKHLFLFTLPRDGYIVPHRAFDSDEAFARFSDFARAQCQAAKPQTPPIAQV